jgi:hypothetical protein
MPACFAPATSGKAQRQLIAKSRIVRRISGDAGTEAPMLYVPKVKLNLLLGRKMDGDRSQVILVKLKTLLLLLELYDH